MAPNKEVSLIVLLCTFYHMTSQEIVLAPSNAEYLNLLTINNFCQDTSAISDSVVTFLNGTHQLRATCDIMNASNVTLKAQQGTKVIITCEKCGFRFLNVSQLKISDIEFRGCGAAWRVELHLINYIVRIAALVFVNGSNLTLTGVKATYKGICIENVAGNVTLDACEVTNSPSSLIFYSIPEDVVFKLTNSLFDDNGPNMADDHGALHLITQRPSFLIVNTTFSNNLKPIVFAVLSPTICPGSSRVESELSSTDSRRLLSIIDSKFVDGVGSGLVILWPTHSHCMESVLIDIINTTFERNRDSFKRGGGVALHLSREKTFSQKSYRYRFKPDVTISGCVFVNNSAAGVPETAAIAADGVPQLRLDNIVIDSNSCSGILARATALVFSGSARIANNRAQIGGGLHLVNIHFIKLAPKTDLIITNNFAQTTGGGIHLDNTCTNAYLPCFDADGEFTDSSVSFKVSSNHAPKGGDNIFGQFPCRYYSGIPNNSRILNSSVSTRPVGVTIDGDVCMVSHYQHCFRQVALYPGQKVVFLMLMFGIGGIIDEENFESGLVSGTVIASVSGASIQELEKLQRIDMSGSNVTYTLYSTNNTRATLVMQPTSMYCWSILLIYINITFRNCPLGFNFTKVRDRFLCHCSNNVPQVINCSIQAQTITKQKDSWLGKYDLNNHSYLAASDYCPYDYCKSTFQDIRTDNLTLYQDEQCQHNRTGILCGSCPEGWSLVLGSSKCRKECSNVWLLLILPFALAGLLLVAAVHFLNLTVTMGTVSSLIFYANVIQDYSVTVLSKYTIPGLTPILCVFLSWLNLDLGIPTCFYSGMDAFGKTLLLFIFPTYIWLISATIIVLSNRYMFFTRLAGRNTVKVLSTLFLLSYSKIFHAAVDCLKLASINVYFNDSTSSEMRWAVDGTILYFDFKKHLALFVVALFFIFLLLPFSVSLLCIRHVYSLSNCCRVFSCVDKLKPFFDTYTGPFKDRARFWTGLLLHVRLILTIVHAMDYSNDAIPYFIIVAMCFILSAIIVSLRGVYKKQSLNILEHFFILNIGIVFLVNSYSGGSDAWKSIFTHVLVSLACLVFLGIVAYHAYLKFSPHCTAMSQLLRLCSTNCDADRLGCEGMRGYQPVQQDLDTLAH